MKKLLTILLILNFIITSAIAQFTLFQDIGLESESGNVSTIIQDEYSDGFYFVLRRNINLENDELWYSNGTVDGTLKLASFNSLSTTNEKTESRNYGFANGYIYISPYNGNNSELWVSKGTIASTKKIYDLIGSTGLSSRTSFSGDTYFYFEESTEYGVKLFYTSGTSESIKRVRPGNSIGVVDNTVHGICELNGKLFYIENISHNLVEFDPNTGIATDINTDKRVQYIIATDDALYLFHDYDLYRLGSGNQFELLYDFKVSDYGYMPLKVMVNSTDLIFSMTKHTGTKDQLLELYRVGTNKNCEKISQFSKGDILPNINDYWIQNNELHFTIKIGSEYSIWKTDGTSGGTIQKISDVHVGVTRFSAGVAIMNGYTFSGCFYISNNEQIKISSYKLDVSSNGAAFVGGKYFTLANDGNSGTEIWYIELDSISSQFGSGSDEETNEPEANEFLFDNYNTSSVNTYMYFDANKTDSVLKGLFKTAYNDNMQRIYEKYIEYNYSRFQDDLILVDSLKKTNVTNYYSNGAVKSIVEYRGDTIFKSKTVFNYDSLNLMYDVTRYERKAIYKPTDFETPELIGFEDNWTPTYKTTFLISALDVSLPKFPKLDFSQPSDEDFPIFNSISDSIWSIENQQWENLKDYDDGSGRRTVFTYNSNGDVVWEYYYIGPTTIGSKKQYHYNENKQLIKLDYYSFNSILGELYFNFSYNYAYNDTALISKIETNSAGLNVGKESYAIDDYGFKQTSYYSWDGVDWVYNGRSHREYDSNGNVTSNYIYHSKTPQKYTYEFNSNNELEDVKRYYYIDTTGVLSWHEMLSYSEDNLPKTYKQYTNGSTLELNLQIDYEYALINGLNRLRVQHKQLPMSGQSGTYEVNYFEFECKQIDTTKIGAVTICNGDQYIFGTQTLTEAGEYSETLASMSGCDSVLALILIVNTTFAETEIAAICHGEEYKFGTQTLTKAGEYKENFQSITGCDSVVTLTLTVNTVDNTVTQEGASLTANAANATYQWVTCGNELSTINGEMNQTFIATAKGDYAVIVSDNSCVDTSICYNVVSTGVVENSLNEAFMLYPNPTNGNLNIDSKLKYDKIQVIVFNASGQQVYRHEFENEKLLNMNLSELSKGIYAIKLNTENQTAVYRISKE